MKTFYSVVVLKPDVFETVIIDERHFETMEEVKQFKNKQAEGNCIVIIEM